jgi:probable HAF family extracellular repeat protein
MMARYIIGLILFNQVWLIASHQLAVAAHGIFIPLGDLPGGDFFSQAYEVSGDGSVVVGVSQTENGREAFTWSPQDGMVSLGVPAGMRGTSAWGVSSNGSVVAGSLEMHPQPERTAFVWTALDGVVPLQGCACNEFDSATAVSGDGQYVVGRMFTSGGPRAYRWSMEDGALNLGDLPGGNTDSHANAISHDGSVVVGSSGTVGGYRAFRWTADSGMVDLGNFRPGGESQAIDVSSDGSIAVGYGSGAPGGQEAAMWIVGESIRGLGQLPGGSSPNYAHGVSDDGTVVVGGARTQNRFEAFRWTDKSGMRTIQSLLASLGVNTSGWRIEYAHGISHDGTVIIGSAINPDGHSEAFLASIPASYVPEPSSALLALTGGLVTLPLALCRRRRDVRDFGSVLRNQQSQFTV